MSVVIQFIVNLVESVFPINLIPLYEQMVYPSLRAFRAISPCTQGRWGGLMPAPSSVVNTMLGYQIDPRYVCITRALSFTRDRSAT